jgi:hypothetical protein
VRDRKLTALCRVIRNLLPDQTAAPPAASSPAAVASRAVLRSVAGEQRALLHGVPALPPSYLARDDVTTIRDSLLSGDQMALGLAGICPVSG